MKRRRKPKQQWTFDFYCGDCDHMRQSDDGDYCIICAQRKAAGSPSPIVLDFKNRTGSCGRYKKISETAKNEN